MKTEFEVIKAALLRVATPLELEIEEMASGSATIQVTRGYSGFVTQMDFGNSGELTDIGAWE